MGVTNNTIEILAVSAFDNSGNRFILRRIENPYTPFASHWESAEHDYYHGHYYETETEAWRDYNDRIEIHGLKHKV